jgi:peptidoglycan/xylan/chitin deacetylase (PgdA/CDA1 family)
MVNFVAGFRFSVPLLTLIGALTAGCARAPEDAIERVARAQLSTYAELGFEPQPAYLPKNTIVLTFDDGPDVVHTPQVLDLLAARKVKASFFINTVNYGDATADPKLQAVIKRIVAEGHELGNHTIHHTDLETLSPAEIDAEIAGVEALVRKPEVVGPSAPRLSLVRAPYGRPYQKNDPSMPSDGRWKVGPIVARHGVHVGWNISVHDSGCADSACVLNNFTGYVKTAGTGNYGIVLLHSVHARTLQALPGIIDHCQANGFVFRTVEDVVRMKYGKSSAELTDAWRALEADGGAPDAPPPEPRPEAPDAGVADSAPADQPVADSTADVAKPDTAPSTAPDTMTATPADAHADAKEKPRHGGGCSFSGF